MSILNNIGYSYNDLTIVPEKISNIQSRSQCNVWYDNNRLPIFTAPMASVVDIKNYKTFDDNGITPIIPRNIDFNERIKLMYKKQWVALSLKEFEDYFINKINDDLKEYTGVCKVCVDIANGHMKNLYYICKDAKILAHKYSYKLEIMTGNIANPQTYKWIIDHCWINSASAENAIDYIRVGIGGGSGCITTSNTSIHYPQASLINECNKYKEKGLKVPAIVADGGIRNYDHVIKALALGADYVMIGSVFAQCIESAGMKTSRSTSQKVPIRFPVERYERFSVNSNENFKAYLTEETIEKYIEPWKAWKDDPEKYQEKLDELHQERLIGQIEVKFFGMASADGQKSIDGEKKKTAEGITKWLPVKYTLSGWTENMISYLRSAMSYCNCYTLNDFIGNVILIPNTISEIQAVNK